MSDVMDTLAGLPPGSPLAELRRQRPDVVRHLQGSDDVIFLPGGNSSGSFGKQHGDARQQVHWMNLFCSGWSAIAKLFS